jgi:hypothetical protein
VHGDVIIILEGEPDRYHSNSGSPIVIMLWRPLTRSSRAAKFVLPAAPLRARFITSSPNAQSPTTTVKAKGVQGEAPLFKSPSDPNKLSARDLTEGTYEKGLETSSEPVTTYSGTRSYVVNEPDPADSKYEIPTGAYHSTASYQKSKEVKYEGYGGERGVKERSSSSSELAHPVTTKRVRGGGDGGLDLMDKEGTKEGVDWVLEKKPVGKE